MLQDTRLVYKSQLYFCILAMNNPKKKENSVSNSVKIIKYIRINLTKTQETFTVKTTKHS